MYGGKMKIYISGKITGDPNYKEKFKKAVHFLIENKDDFFPLEKESFIINPAELQLPENASWSDYMKIDIKTLLDCDAIYMLKDWKESEGAKLEHHIADKMNIKIFYQ